MNVMDWVVLIGTLSFIVIYGVYKTRGARNVEGYLMGGHDMKWYTIGLSVMATQASAITFLSTPGQAFEDGMGFVQFYFGLPIAMVILCVTFLPIFYRLNVFTAYEYLESRFDLNTRLLAAFLFLLQRGLAAGITIYAPSIILSSILGWNLNFTNFFIGTLVIIYTVSGGTKAVSQTQKQQMLVILTGMVIAFIIILKSLPVGIGFSEAMDVAGAMNKLEIVNFDFDFNERYTFWSGITGGLFLALSYFGTDQSQVQRYLSGKSLKEGRFGLLFNGLLKVPMQFLILLTGVMVFVFYQFEKAPVFFNEAGLEGISDKKEFQIIQEKYDHIHSSKEIAIHDYLKAQQKNEHDQIKEKKERIISLNQEYGKIRKEAKALIERTNPLVETKDTDYVFITFIMNYLPHGIIGLLLAVIFSAAMSSTAGELNALGSTTLVDFYKRTYRKEASEKHYVVMSRVFTAFWGLLAIAFAVFASLVENLIQAVNILGSLFYGTILGIFLVAFYFKSVKSKAVFIAALISEVLVLIIYSLSDISFLWFNAIGCILVILLAFFLTFVIKTDIPKTK